MDESAMPSALTLRIKNPSSSEDKYEAVDTLIDIAYALQTQYDTFKDIKDAIEKNRLIRKAIEASKEINEFISDLLPTDSVKTYLKNKNPESANKIFEGVSNNLEHMKKLSSNPKILKDILTAKTSSNESMQPPEMYNFPENFYSIFKKMLLIEQINLEELPEKKDIFQLSRHVDKHKKDINPEFYSYLKKFSTCSMRLKRIISNLFTRHMEYLTDVAELNQALYQRDILQIYKKCTYLTQLKELNKEILDAKKSQDLEKIIRTYRITYQKLEILIEEYRKKELAFSKLYETSYKTLDSATRNLRGDQFYLKKDFLGLRKKTLEENPQKKSQPKQKEDLKSLEPARSIEDILANVDASTKKTTKNKRKKRNKKKTIKIAPIQQPSEKSQKKESPKAHQQNIPAYQTAWITEKSSAKLSELCNALQIQKEIILSLKNLNKKNAKPLLTSILNKYTYLTKGSYTSHTFLQHMRNIIKHSEKFLDKSRKRNLSSFKQAIRTFENDRCALEDLEVSIFSALLNKHHEEAVGYKKITLNMNLSAPESPQKS